MNAVLQHRILLGREDIFKIFIKGIPILPIAIVQIVVLLRSRLLERREEGFVIALCQIVIPLIFRNGHHMVFIILGWIRLGITIIPVRTVFLILEADKRIDIRLNSGIRSSIVGQRHVFPDTQQLLIGTFIPHFHLIGIDQVTVLHHDLHITSGRFHFLQPQVSGLFHQVHIAFRKDRHMIPQA